MYGKPRWDKTTHSQTKQHIEQHIDDKNRVLSVLETKEITLKTKENTGLSYNSISFLIQGSYTMGNVSLFFGKVLKYILLLFASAILGVVLLYLVYLIPSERVKRNADRSFEELSREFSHPTLDENNKYLSTLDNFTDSMMISNSSTEREGYSKLLSAISGTHDNVYNLLFVDRRTIEHEKHTYDYTRYWHGYQIIIRPLLCFFDYSGIRAINTVVFIAALLVAMIAVYKKIGLSHSAAFLFTVISLYPPGIMCSLQNSCMYYILTVSVAIFCMVKRKYYNYVFLFSGIATAYFDFLTYPVLVPCILLALVVSEDDHSVWSILLKMLKYFFLWGSGYAGMWLLKWIVVYMIWGDQFLDSLVSAINTRSGSGVLSNVQVLPVIFKYFSSTITLPLVVLSLCYILFQVAAMIKKGMNKEKLYKIPLILIMPLVVITWMLLTKEHVWVHHFLVCRNFGVFYFCFYLLFAFLAGNKIKDISDQSVFP